MIDGSCVNRDDDDLKDERCSFGYGDDDDDDGVGGRG